MNYVQSLQNMSIIVLIRSSRQLKYLWQNQHKNQNRNKAKLNLIHLIFFSCFYPPMAIIRSLLIYVFSYLNTLQKNTENYQLKHVQSIYKLNIMKIYKSVYIFVALSLLLFISNPQPSVSDESEYFSHIGDYVTGKISMKNQGIVVHNFDLPENEKVEKKFLFLRINSHGLLKSPALTIYNYQTKKLIHSCEFKEYDECYIRNTFLFSVKKISIVVSGQSEDTYNLITNWGDLEHLGPNDDIKFMFGQNTSQIFHVEFPKDKPFQQLRIILSPETFRADFDKLKIFANYKTDQEPTQQQFDKQSKRVWGNSEAIFFSKEELKNKDKALIYIVGNANTIYRLQCQYINQTHHDIELNEVIYEYLQGNSTYVYHLQSSRFNHSIYDEYAFKFSVFSGHLSIGYFTDQKLKKPLKKQPLQYMSDQQFLFSKNQLINDIKDIYIKVWCSDASTIYQIEVQGRASNLAYEITEDIYEFAIIKNQRKVMYFRYPIFVDNHNEQLDEGVYSFEISSIKVMGQYSLQFYVCKQEINCLDLTNQTKFNQNILLIQPAAQPEAGKKTIFTLQVRYEDFQSIFTVQKEIMILAVITPPQTATNFSLMALQFSNPNKVKQIRQDKATEEHIFYNQTKIYKFVNNEEDVNSIMIHYNHVSGLTRLKATFEDPKVPNFTNSEVKESSSKIFQFKQNLTKPIYLIVTGYADSIFVLTAVVEHKGHAGSAMTLAEDISYPITLQPLQSKLIEIHPIQQYVEFNFKSVGGTISICEADFYGLCIFNSQLSVEQKSSGTIKIDSSSKRSLKFKIFNGINFNNSSQIKELPNTVNVNIFYHAQGTQHCQTRLVNHLYNEVLDSGDCLQFKLPKANNLQIIAKKKDIGRNFKMFVLCSNIFTPAIKEDRFIISTQEIQENCKNSLSDLTLNLYLMDPVERNQTKIRYEYAVQYRHMAIMLEDGLSYSKQGVVNQKQMKIKAFTYLLADKKKTHTIMLFNKKGNQNFYGKIVKKQSEYSFLLLPTTSQIQGKGEKNPTFDITPQMIQSTPACQVQQCELYLAVYSKQQAGTQFQFTFQIVSTSIQLNEDEVRDDFLSKNTFKYYRYDVKKDNSTLYVKVSDNNQQCSKIYISKKDHPSSTNMLKSSTYEELILQNAEKETYYIGIEAIQECSYSISIGESKAKITRLKYGSFYDLKLQKGEKKLFLIRHTQDKLFKILTLEKLGKLKISANQSFLSQSKLQQISDGKFNTSEFLITGKERNTLVVSKQDKGFCSNCSYLIAVEAEQMTDSSIIYVGQRTVIPLSSRKQFFDKIINQENNMFLSYQYVSSGNITTKVYSGNIKIELTYSDQHFEFETNAQSSTQEYNFTQNLTISEPILIKITATKVPAVYSLIMKPESPSQVPIKMTAGSPSILSLNQNQSECINGYLRNQKQLIFFTVATRDDYKLQSLNIIAKLNSKQTEKFSKQAHGNILTINFAHESYFFKDPIQYEICLQLQNQETLTLTAFQNQNVNILPTNTQTIIIKQGTFILHPDGDFFIDLFSCASSADLKYSHQLSNINEGISQDLEKIGIPGQDHAVRMETTDPIYLSIKSELATVRWIPLNIEKERGLGYIRFKIGNLYYQNQFNQIKFYIGGISQIKDTKAKVESIRYTLYIADSVQNLQKAIMCQKSPQKVMKFSSIYESKNENIVNQTINIIANKNKIKQKFDGSQTLYYNVIADLTIQPPVLKGENNQKEQYKFVYQQQQVPSAVFAPNSFEQVDVGVLTLIILITIAVIVGLGCLFVQFVVPAVGRLRNRMFIQESEQKNNDSIPVPQSSDRNRVTEQDQPQTQEQMNN